MASFVVMRPPEKTGAGEQELPLMVRDGFSVFGFILGPLWLTFHRLWLEAAIALAVMIGLNAVGLRLGVEGSASWLSLLVSLWIGLEGSALRLASLRRRGYADLGVVEASNPDQAELRFAYAGEEQVEVQPWTPGPSLPSAAKPAGRQTSPALGLFNYPGKA